MPHKFTITKASDWKYNEEKEFSSLEELLEWIDTLRCEVIIYPRQSEDLLEITIYDSYME